MKEREYTGFVIKRKNYRDSDRIVTLFSKEEGKVGFIAKGIKKPKAKLTSFIEPFVESKYRLIGGGNLPVLVGAKNLSKNQFYDAGLTVRVAAAVATEVLELITLEGQKNKGLYTAYKACLSDLQDSAKPILMLDFHIAKMMSMVGVEPSISLDKLSKLYFDFDEGTISKRRLSTATVPLSYDCAKLYKAISSYGSTTIVRLRVESSLADELLHLLIRYLEYHFARKIKGAKILFEMGDSLQASD